MAMQVIDFHNHYYPPQYLAILQEEPSHIQVAYDSEKNPLLHYPGDCNILVPGHRDIDYRQAYLATTGVDIQVLSFTSPGCHVESPALAARIAREVNDEFARIVRERKDCYTALGTLPLNDPKASVEEFERASSELGFAGFMLFSNINGTALSDPCYWPLYEKANQRESVLYIHPIHPVGVEAMTDYRLMPLVGFTFDTSLAAAKLVFSGVVERFPKIRWVLAHLGGAIPYLAERLDRGYAAFEDCRRNIRRPPSEYLRRFYYDTVNFDPHCLKLALDFAGAEHMLAGSDYPHQIGSIEQMLESIESLSLANQERRNVLGGNTARLLGLG